MQLNAPNKSHIETDVLQKMCNKVSHSSYQSRTQSQRNTDACSWMKQKKEGAEGTAIQDFLAKSQSPGTAPTPFSVALAMQYRGDEQVELHHNQIKFQKYATGPVPLRPAMGTATKSLDPSSPHLPAGV